MTRLIEVDDVRACAPAMSVKVGDLLVFAASGGRVSTGGSAVRCLGAYMRAVIGTNRAVLEPQGLPNAVVFEALQPGQAAIDVTQGDPFGSSALSTLLVTVRPA